MQKEMFGSWKIAVLFRGTGELAPNGRAHWIEFGGPFQRRETQVWFSLSQPQVIVRIPGCQAQGTIDAGTYYPVGQGPAARPIPGVATEHGDQCARDPNNHLHPIVGE